MTDTHSLLQAAYAAFNRRDIDSALACMSERVTWPKASEGGNAVGKEEIRSYWTHQWSEFDPHVEPVEILNLDSGQAKVRVHQTVRSLTGELLWDGEVWHTYRFSGGLIESMTLHEPGQQAESVPSAAFRRP